MCVSLVPSTIVAEAEALLDDDDLVVAFLDMLLLPLFSLLVASMRTPTIFFFVASRRRSVRVLSVGILSWFSSSFPACLVVSLFLL